MNYTLILFPNTALPHCGTGKTPNPFQSATTTAIFSGTPTKANLDALPAQGLASKAKTKWRSCASAYKIAFRKRFAERCIITRPEVPPPSTSSQNKVSCPSSFPQAKASGAVLKPGIWTSLQPVQISTPDHALRKEAVHKRDVRRCRPSSGFRLSL
ncbi:MAG: hypothetical protein HN736_15415 [Anaerolineae bacterium]|nr:hypothetical protein [Anaerolineae bacterium]